MNDWGHDNDSATRLRRIEGKIDQLINLVITGDQRILEAIQHPPVPAPNAAKIFQIIGGKKAMSITGVVPGGPASLFEVDPIINGVAGTVSQWPAGTVDSWTDDDPLSAIGPVDVPNKFQVTVAIPANDLTGSMAAGGSPAPGTTGSYNLTSSVQLPTPPSGVQPAPIVTTVNVPINIAPVPVPTSSVINQLS
jgi:hypothetical protein